MTVAVITMPRAVLHIDESMNLKKLMKTNKVPFRIVIISCHSRMGSHSLSFASFADIDPLAPAHGSENLEPHLSISIIPC